MINPEIASAQIFARKAIASDEFLNNGIAPVAPVCKAGATVMRRMFAIFQAKHVKFVRGVPIGVNRKYMIIDNVGEERTWFAKRVRIVTVTVEDRKWFALKDCTKETFDKVSPHRWLSESDTNHCANGKVNHFDRDGIFLTGKE